MTIVVEGLEGDSGVRAALLSKFSHAITDGLGGIALFEQVYDTERDPAPRPMPPVPIPRDVTGTDLVRASLRRLPETTVAAGADSMPLDYDGVTHYFCCAGCRKAFEEDPAAYVKRLLT